VVTALSIIVVSFAISSFIQWRDPVASLQRQPVMDGADAPALAIDAEAPAEPPVQAADLDDAASTPSAAVRSAIEPAARQAAIDVAKGIWAKFDRLPGRTYRTRGALRSKAVLDAALVRANAETSELGPDDAAAVRAFNAAESRRRFPALLGAGEKGSVRGADATTIVPSSNPEQCKSMAEAWIEGDVPRILLEAGFSDIGCEGDGGFTSWRLDGHL
jgi:hypothetical protein